MKKIINSSIVWRTSTFLLLAFLVYGQVGSSFIQENSLVEVSNYFVVKDAYASEIYPMFTCPCCGEPLDKEDPCCEAMEQMIDFIDQQVSLDKTKDEVVLVTAKEFGLDRLTEEKDRIALKRKLIDLAPADAAKIEIDEASRDLGIVSQRQGVISTDFEFKNTGKSDLVINKLSSSCGCTSASIVYKGNVGPKFTMEGHGQKNPTDWKISIKPQESAILRVFYDPSVHPDLEGAVTRSVSIFSNDPVEYEIKVVINLEQTK